MISGSDCPYLARETIAYRESLDLSREARTLVITTWQCTHPFHGIAVDLGEVQRDVDRRCSQCRLPHAGEAPGGDAAPSRESSTPEH
jgi:hypothetical protein